MYWYWSRAETSGPHVNGGPVSRCGPLIPCRKTCSQKLDVGAPEFDFGGGGGGHALPSFGPVLVCMVVFVTVSIAFGLAVTLLCFCFFRYFFVFVTVFLSTFIINFCFL